MKQHIQLLIALLGLNWYLPAQDPKPISESPVYREWVDLTRGNGSVLKALIVYPESGTSTKAIILIHENLGLNEWIMTFSQELADQGFLVIVPDLISNTVEGVEKTTDFENTDKVRDAIYALEQEQITMDLNAVYNYVKNDASGHGEISVIGFSWGGSQSFHYATQNPNLENVIVYYGTAPEDLSTLKNIKSPVYGFYGGADNRVNISIPDTEASMKEYGNLYFFDIYESVGHAFMSRGAQEKYGPNTMAYEKSWNKLISILK